MKTLETLTETATGLGRDARESMDALAQSAGKRLDDAREETAGALHTAADRLRGTGREGCGKIDSLAAGAAERLNATAIYVEDHDLSAMFRGLRRFGLRHPVSSLVAVAAAGFVVGSTLTRVAHSCERATAHK